MITAFVFDAYGTLYDVQSVAELVERTFPGHGDYITQLWRLKQLEYSWLRSLGGDYADFWTVTRESLSYTLGTLGITPDESLFAEIAGAYNALRPYPDAESCLAGLTGFRRAIFSNGSPEMLSAMVGNSSLAPHLEAVISVDAKQVYKPDPRSYRMVEEALGVRPSEVLFVSSNGFDVCGAKRAGFKVARIERVSNASLAHELASSATIGPKIFYKAQRLQPETYGEVADYTVSALGQLPDLIRSISHAP